MANEKFEGIPILLKFEDLEKKYEKLSNSFINLQKDTEEVKKGIATIMELLQKNQRRYIGEKEWTPSGKQLQLIEYLANNNGEAKMKDLSKDSPGAGMVESTVSQTVRTLVKKNIIEKVPDSEDPSSRYKLRLNVEELKNNYEQLPTFIQRILSKDKKEADLI